MWSQPGVRQLKVVRAFAVHIPVDSYQAFKSGIRCLLLSLLLGAFVFGAGEYCSWDAILGARIGRAARISLSARLALSCGRPTSSGCSARLSCDSLARNRVSGLSVELLVTTRRDCCTSSCVVGFLRKLRCLSLNMRRKKRGMTFKVCRNVAEQRRRVLVLSQKGQLYRVLVVLSKRWRWTVAGVSCGARSCGFRCRSCHWSNDVGL